jgi:SpoVK/Ycf46/Vps4 family AAA+-type ATPase
MGILTGRSPARAVVFIDEIEKSLAGVAGDNTGVSQDQLGALLTFMQDNETMGMIFIGPPGCTKSMLAKAAGNEAKIPTVVFDIGGMKDSRVGESGKKIRQALKIIQAISQGKAMFIATCNSIAILPPELRRRFTLGTFFFDLPSNEERKIIWDLYFKKYEIPEEQRDTVADDDWTGAEIKNCCHIAWMRNCKLSEAAGFVVPVAKSAFDQISALRKQASGKYISAGAPGFYQFKMTSELHDMYRAIDVSEKEVKQ